MCAALCIHTIIFPISSNLKRDQASLNLNFFFEAVVLCIIEEQVEYKEHHHHHH